MRVVQPHPQPVWQREALSPEWDLHNFEKHLFLMDPDVPRGRRISYARLDPRYGGPPSRELFGGGGIQHSRKLRSPDRVPPSRSLKLSCGEVLHAADPKEMPEKFRCHALVHDQFNDPVHWPTFERPVTYPTGGPND